MGLKVIVYGVKGDRLWGKGDRLWGKGDRLWGGKGEVYGEKVIVYGMKQRISLEPYYISIPKRRKSDFSV